MLLPEQFEIIPHDVYTHYCSKYEMAKIVFSATMVSNETQINYHLSRRGFRFDYVLAALYDYLAFPYTQYEESSPDVQIERQVLTRLGYILETLDDERGKSYVSDFVSQLVDQSYRQLPKRSGFKELTIADIEARNPTRSPGETAIVEIDEVNSQSKSLIPTSELEVFKVQKHHFLFLHQLGIIDYLKEHFSLPDGKSFDDYTMADIIARISGYDSSDNLRVYLHELDNNSSSFVTKKSTDEVERIMNELKIVRKSP